MNSAAPPTTDDGDDDPVLRELIKARDSLVLSANKAGAGPGDRRKSELKTEAERASFIDAWGLEAYKSLPD